jgi:hypothetical protein
LNRTLNPFFSYFSGRGLHFCTCHYASLIEGGGDGVCVSLTFSPGSLRTVILLISVP